MFYLREASIYTNDPVFQALRKDCLMFPDSPQIARDFAMSGSYEQRLIDWAVSLIDPATVFLDIGFFPYLMPKSRQEIYLNRMIFHLIYFV